MKIAYIDFYGFSKTDKASSGVERKITAQIKALSTLGEVDRHSYETHTQSRLLRYVRMITRRLPFLPSKIAYKCDASYQGVDTLYFRRTTLDSYAIRFFRDFKRQNPNGKVIMEIPTYPYDKEMANLIEFPRLLKDIWNRKKLKRYVDRIVTFSEDKEIFGIPTIRTMNGLDFASVKIKDVTTPSDDTIQAVMVANFAPWHGLDRLIEGLHRYYLEGGMRNIILHIVGDGVVVEKEKRLIMGTPLENKVVFHGRLSLDEMAHIYDLVTLAIDTCNDEYQGVLLSSSLKTREYTAKGLPVVGAMEIDLMRYMQDFFLILKGKDYIDINEVIKFHDNVYQRKEDYLTVPKIIRDRAQSLCDMQVTMKPILDFLISE